MLRVFDKNFVNSSSDNQIYMVPEKRKVFEILEPLAYTFLSGGLVLIPQFHYSSYYLGFSG